MSNWLSCHLTYLLPFIIPLRVFSSWWDRFAHLHAIMFSLHLFVSVHAAMDEKSRPIACWPSASDTGHGRHRASHGCPRAGHGLRRYRAGLPYPPRWKRTRPWDKPICYHTAVVLYVVVPVMCGQQLASCCSFLASAQTGALLFYAASHTFCAYNYKRVELSNQT